MQDVCQNAIANKPLHNGSAVVYSPKLTLPGNSGQQIVFPTKNHVPLPSAVASRLDNKLTHHIVLT